MPGTGVYEEWAYNQQDYENADCTSNTSAPTVSPTAPTHAPTFAPTKTDYYISYISCIEVVCDGLQGRTADVPTQEPTKQPTAPTTQSTQTTDESGSFEVNIVYAIWIGIVS